MTDQAPEQPVQPEPEVERRNPKRRRRDDFEIGAITVGFFLLLLAVAGIYFQGQHLDHQQRQISHQQHQLGHLAKELKTDRKQLGNAHLELVEACKRLQIVRVEDNVSHYADYKVFRAAAVVISHGAFRESVEQAIRAKSWVPVTNCAKAVNEHGVRYLPPRPVPFYKELPSKSALTLSANDFR